MTDRTFDEQSVYGSKRWVAATLGLSLDMFNKSLDTLRGDGFPEPDKLIGLWIKNDVFAWVNKRRRIADHDIVVTPKPHKGVNHDRL